MDPTLSSRECQCVRVHAYQDRSGAGGGEWGPAGPSLILPLSRPQLRIMLYTAKTSTYCEATIHQQKFFIKEK